MTAQFGEIRTHRDAIYERYNPADFIGREWLVDEITKFRDSGEEKIKVIVGEPGSGKSAFLAYLAEKWNCPRHFMRFDNISGVTGIAPRTFLISIGEQLHQKYGKEIFGEQGGGSTTVIVGIAKDKAEVVGRVVDTAYTLPFLKPVDRDIQVRAAYASGDSQVIGERIKKLYDVTEALSESELLHVMVINPLKKLQEIHPDEIVVILVDALDESLQQPGVKIPEVIPSPSDPDFPKNLRFVMTSREGDHLNRFQEHVVKIDDDTKSVKNRSFKDLNEQDVKDYIRNRLNRDELAPLAHQWDDDKVKTAYIDNLSSKSERNFLYLYHFFNELNERVKNGETDLSKIGIPSGLNGIYRDYAVMKIRTEVSSAVRFTVLGDLEDDFVEDLKNTTGVKQIDVTGSEVTLELVKDFEDTDGVTEKLFALAGEYGIRVKNLKTPKRTDWEKNYLPILGVLAVGYEALTRSQIAKFARVEDTYVDRIISHLKQFLDVTSDETEKRYRIFHLTFADYLLDSARNQDYPLDGPNYHRQIADFLWQNHYSNWDTIDDYGLNRLGSHLYKSSQFDRLSELITQTWMDVRFRRSGYRYDGFLTDLWMAWESTHNMVLKQIASKQMPYALVDSIRWALIHTSVNSLSGKYVPELVGRAVETGLWTIERAISVADKSPDIKQRSILFRVLLETNNLSTDQRVYAEQESLSAALALREPKDRSMALTALLPLLSDRNHQKTLQQAITAIRAITFSSDQAFAIEALAPYLTGDLVQPVLVIALAIKKAYHRLEALKALLSRMTGKSLKDGMDIVLTINKEDERVDALIALIPNLKGKILYQGIALVERIKNPFDRVRALTALMPLLMGKFRKDILNLGLASIRSIRNKRYKKEALLMFVAQLVDKDFQQISKEWETVTDIQLNVIRCEVSALRPSPEGNISPHELNEKLDMAIEEFGYSDDLIELAPHLSGELLQKAINATTTIDDEYYQVQAIATLASQLSGSLQQKISNQALLIASNIRRERQRAHALVILAPFIITDDQLQQGIKIMEGIEDEYPRLNALTGLLPRCPIGMLQIILKREMTVALSSDSVEYRVYAFSALIPYLQGKDRQQAIIYGLSALQDEDHDDEEKAESIIAIAPHVTGKMLKQVVAMMQNLDDKWEKVRVAGALMPQLTGKLRQAVVMKALHDARSINDNYLRVSALGFLMPYLKGKTLEDVLEEGLTDVRAIKETKTQVQALCILMPNLRGEFLHQGFVIAQTFDNHYRMQALGAFRESNTSDLNQLKDIVNLIRLDLAESMFARRHIARQKILSLCANEFVLASPILDKTSLFKIADSIIEICSQWVWS